MSLDEGWAAQFMRIKGIDRWDVPLEMNSVIINAFCFLRTTNNLFPIFFYMICDQFVCITNALFTANNVQWCISKPQWIKALCCREERRSYSEPVCTDWKMQVHLEMKHYYHQAPLSTGAAQKYASNVFSKEESL